jgi:hypothetical protein
MASTSREDFTSEDTPNNRGTLSMTFSIFARSKKKTNVINLERTRVLIWALYRVSKAPDGTVHRPFVYFVRVSASDKKRFLIKDSKATLIQPTNVCVEPPKEM